MTVARVLLFTDVEDSTAITERLGDERASRLWAEHDRIVRRLLREGNGREIDKSDGFLLLFEAVEPAVRCAIAVHEALSRLDPPLRSRAGIHRSEMVLRDNSADDLALGARPLELDGVGKAIASRIMSLARGGQTLLSAQARAALRSGPWRLKSHGFWRLKGVAHPIELFEAGDGACPFAPPADSDKAYRVLRSGEGWMPLAEMRHGLPAERDAYVGRTAALAELAQKFDAGARLVSVLGIGGVGKTRFALRYARQWLGDYRGGAWFCDLSAARNRDDVLQSVARSLDLPLGHDDPVRQLGEAIAGRRSCLLILDNFEQVARHAEATVGRWLEAAPHARFLVTSREILGIVGEQTFTLPPLTTEEAWRLFCRRAEAVDGRFSAAGAEQAAARSLIELLDRLPLAIELAASRVRVMRPTAMLERMGERFKLLASAGRRHDRQATLRAAFGWSWDLLDETEKASLARLSSFEGGFSLRSCAGVLGTEIGPEREPVADVLQSLLDKSLVQPAADSRFDLLSSVREYAQEHLRSPGRFAGSGPACAADAYAHHARYFGSLGEAEAVAQRCVELPNLVAGCKRAVEAVDGKAAVGCLVNAWAALRLRGPCGIAVELADAVGRLPDLGAAERAAIDWVAGSALSVQGASDRARERLEHGLALTRGDDSGGWRARLLLALGALDTLDGRLETAFDALNQAHDAAAAQGDLRTRALALNGLGRLMDHQARLGEARDCYQRALALARSLGDRHLEGGLLGNLGGLHHDLGEIEQARSLYRQAIEIAHEVGDRRWEGNGHCNLGLLLQEHGEAQEARAQFDQALALAREAGHVRLEYTVLCNLGILLSADGQLAEATATLQQAVDAAVAAADRRSEGQFLGYLALVHARRGRHDEARASLDRGEQLLLQAADRLRHALLMCDRAEVEQLAGRDTAVTAAWRKAEAIADELACGPDSELRRRLGALSASQAISRR